MNKGASTWEGADMPETVQMQQAEHPAHWQSSYLGRALSKAWVRVTFAGPRDQQPDGLEAFDMLGGWKGSDVRRRDIS